MHLLLDQRNIVLSVNNERLQVTKDSCHKQIIPSRIEAIHLLTPCRLTSPVVNWAAKYEIPMLFYNCSGKVIARLWCPHFGSHAAIRISQIEFSRSLEGTFWIKELLIKKTENQLYVLSNIPQNPVITTFINRLKNIQFHFVQDNGFNLKWMRITEANASRWYWTAIALTLKQHIQIMPRSIRPAKDKFNSILNYLYGTLYGLVEGSMLAAGLDPQIGIMHRMEYKTPAFVFDVIEPFRFWADLFLIEKVLTNKIHPGFTEDRNGNTVLSTEGKKELLSDWFQYLNQKTPSPRKLIKRKDQVQQLCTALASRLLKQYQSSARKI